MTPDMKRLVEAVWCQMPVVDGVVISDTEPYPLCEAIVRAVLTELRNPSKEAIAAGAIAIDDAHNSTTESDGHEWTFTDGYDYALPGLQAVIDHILAEPATA